MGGKKAYLPRIQQMDLTTCGGCKITPNIAPLQIDYYTYFSSPPPRTPCPFKLRFLSVAIEYASHSCRDVYCFVFLFFLWKLTGRERGAGKERGGKERRGKGEERG